MPRKTKDNPLGLDPHHGSPVTKVGVTIANAGGGLHAPLDIDNDFAAEVAKTQIGDTRVFLVQADMNADGFKPVKGAESEMRYTLGFHATDTIMLLEDNDWAVDRLHAEREKILRAREVAEGVQRLGEPIEDGPGEAEPSDG